MQNINIFETLVDAFISSQVIRRFFCKIGHTVLSFRSITKLPARPGLGATSVDKRPFLKSLCHLQIRDTSKYLSL